MSLRREFFIGYVFDQPVDVPFFKEPQGTCSSRILFGSRRLRDASWTDIFHVGYIYDLHQAAGAQHI